MTLYGYARVSVREPEDKNLDLQVERLVRAGCSLGNIRAEEASGARNDRGGLGGGAAGTDDRRTVEEFQDAGEIHRAPDGGTGRGGQILPGKEGLGAASQE